MTPQHHNPDCQNSSWGCSRESKKASHVEQPTARFPSLQTLGAVMCSPGPLATSGGGGAFQGVLDHGRHGLLAKVLG